MGLYASVRCPCWEEGRTTEPPVPREWLSVDERDSLVLDGDRGTEEDDERVQEWQQHACPHPAMRYAEERIANWRGCTAFLGALGLAGWGHFPALRAGLAGPHGDLVGPDLARRALAELAYFRSLEALGQDDCLVDSSTGEVFARHADARDGVFHHLCGEVLLEMGVGRSEFFVREAASGACLFSAAALRQTPLGRGPCGRAPGAELEDRHTGERFLCPEPIRWLKPWPDGRWEDDEGRGNIVAPGELHVETRDVRPGEFEYILRPLDEVFRASAETGRPVSWW